MYGDIPGSEGYNIMTDGVRDLGNALQHYCDMQDMQWNQQCIEDAIIRGQKAQQARWELNRNAYLSGGMFI